MGIGASPMFRNGAASVGASGLWADLDPHHESDKKTLVYDGRAMRHRLQQSVDGGWLGRGNIPLLIAER